MNQKEVWKDVKNHEGIYKVSNVGRVKSFKRNSNGVIMSLLNNKGYYQVKLSMYGKCKTRKVHQLVCESFLNHTPCGHKLVVNHINHNKLDNRAENLEIITQRENSNKKHLKSTSKYIGVSWDKSRSKWFSRIRIKYKYKYLGRFKTEKVASAVYQYELNKINNNLNKQL